jgi:hypothetical protein
MCATARANRLPPDLAHRRPVPHPRAVTLSTPIPKHSARPHACAALPYRDRALSHYSLARRLGTAAIDQPLRNVPAPLPLRKARISHLRVCPSTVSFHRLPRRPLRSDLWLLSSSPTPEDPAPAPEAPPERRGHESGLPTASFRPGRSPARRVRRPRSPEPTKFGRGALAVRSSSDRES